MTHLQAIRTAVARSPALTATICARINSAFLLEYQPANEFFDIATDSASVDDLITDFAAIAVPRTLPAGYVEIDSAFRADYGDDYYEMARVYNGMLKLVFLVRDGRLIPRISVDTMTEVCGFREIHKKLREQTRNAKAQVCMRSLAEFYVQNQTTALPKEMRSIIGRDLFETPLDARVVPRAAVAVEWHRGSRGTVY